MINYLPFFEQLKDPELNPIFTKWQQDLARHIEEKITLSNDGNLPRFQKALAELPKLNSQHIDLNANAITYGQREDISDEQSADLNEKLKAFMPWRKGPFELFGTHIDSEWRSDFKWDRLVEHISPLKNRTVLDVGCANGYHCWRMKAEGARLVAGIDPSVLAVSQFFALQHFIQDPTVTVLPITSEEVMPNLNAFDTVFSMGVLYHRRSPFDHLFELRNMLREGGELILETIVIADDEEKSEDKALVPEGRYAKMNNIWFLPSTQTLIGWLRKVGFIDIKCIDITTTTSDEQRLTEWKKGQSLEDFLDPNDPSKTIEGHPAPIRTTIIAKKPDDGRRLPRYS